MKEKNNLDRCDEILRNINFSKKRRYLITLADIHLHNNWSYGKYLSNGVNSDLENKFSILQEAHILANRMNAPLVICGDTLDKRTVDCITLEYFSSWISKITSPFVILSGNHEFDDVSTMFSSIGHYRHFFNKPDQRIVTLPFRFKIQNSEFFCLPASKTLEQNMKEMIKDFKKNPSDSKYKIMLLHGGIQGADMGSMRAPEGISSKMIDECSSLFDWVVCGDFHNFQYVNKKKNVYYCGAPKQMMNNEYKERRGYQIIDLTNKKLHFIDNKDSPKFKVLEYVAGNYIHKWIKNPEKFKKKIKNKILVIKITSTEEDLKTVDFEKIRKSLLANGAFGVYKEQEIINEKRNSEAISENFSKDEMIVKYVENKDYGQIEQTKRDHIKIMKKYAKEK